METYYVRNMVCNRCITAVQNILNQSGITGAEVTLGEARVPQPFSREQLASFAAALEALGFELIDNKKTVLIERVKKGCRDYLAIIEDAGERKENLSAFLARQLHYEYSYLSDLFSSVEGLTIEQYFIRLRIEKAKELLVYDELSLSEIAFQLGYSSVHHLSAQFKKVTGLTPSYFKKIGSGRRKALDQL